MAMARNDGLTPREREVLRHTARGLTNERMAIELGISRNAVRFHLKEIRSKLDTGGKRSRLMVSPLILRMGLG